MTAYPMLLSPVKIAGLKLRNRIVMPPMVTAMKEDSDQFRAWYEARAAGGVGLIIIQALWMDRFEDDAFCEGLRRTVAAIHAHGVPVVQQLFQAPIPMKATIFPLRLEEGVNGPSTEQMAAVPARFARVARRCLEIGYDGVEPHGAHGYFLNQVFDPAHNQRTDQYGGSLEGRMRLGTQIVEAIREEVGSDLAVFYRHTAEGNAYPVTDSVAFCRRLRKAGVDVLDISPSWRGNAHAVIAAEIRAAVGGPVLAVGGMGNATRAERALREGYCDLCAVGRQLIADAEWANKVAQGRLTEIIPCTKCDAKCFGNLRKHEPIGCVRNPDSGQEYLRG
jgi:2,4-dienoyl-CoA reductase-like NADH-dependent reductase (Old Yellow Enzyme family)